MSKKAAIRLEIDRQNALYIASEARSAAIWQTIFGLLSLFIPFYLTAYATGPLYQIMNFITVIGFFYAIFSLIALYEHIKAQPFLMREIEETDFSKFDENDKRMFWNRHQSIFSTPLK
ncbi:MAG: hypothetical protein WD046_04555 [Paracoccaceae bacterium]